MNQFHMTAQAVMSTPYGRMMDLIACIAIDQGGAKQKKVKKHYTFDEALALN